MKAIEQFIYTNDLRDRFFPSYESLNDIQLNSKIEGYNNSIAFLLRHIAQAEDWFLRVVILKENIAPKGKALLPTSSEIISYLKETRARTIDYLEHIDISLLQKECTIPTEGFRGSHIEQPTIGWIINRVFNHEVYHLAQVNMLLRLQGIEPPKM